MATPQNAHVARLQVDTRKWVAAKLLPKKYGDRPAEVNVNTQINLASISVEDQARLQARRLELLKEEAQPRDVKVPAVLLLPLLCTLPRRGEYTRYP